MNTSEGSPPAFPVSITRSETPSATSTMRAVPASNAAHDNVAPKQIPAMTEGRLNLICDIGCQPERNVTSTHDWVDESWTSSRIFLFQPPGRNSATKIALGACDIFGF